MTDTGLAEVRLDKWLKIARFYKKRADAAEAVESGAVKLNGVRVKPSKQIKIGDVITVRKDSRYKDYTVKIVTEKSVSAKIARELYDAPLPDPADLEGAEVNRMMDVHLKENRKAWKTSFDNKKKRRDLTKKKYSE